MTCDASASVGSLYRHTVSTTDILRMALVAGMALGFMEAGQLAFSRHVLGRMIYQGVHYCWLAPLVDALLLLVLGSAVAIVSRFVPLVAQFQVVVWIYVFVIVVGLRGIFPRVHLASWLILACGLATFFSRGVLRVRCGVRTLNLSLLTLLVLWAATAAATGLTQRASEQRAIAALSTPPANAPNVLWIVMDTTPAKRLSMYGYARPTSPHLERFARTGVVFDHCMSSTSWTLPSHATMFSGKLRHEQDCGWTKPLGAQHRMIAEVLRDRGYATGGFAANALYLSREFGLAQGFCRYREPRTLLGQAIQSSQLANSIAKRTLLPVFNGQVVGRKTGATINANCLEWLAQLSKDRPYFAFLNYMETHTPYVPSPSNAARFGVTKSITGNLDLDGGLIPNQEGWLENLVHTYDACVADLDQHIGRLLNDLSRRGHLENTLVIITADHGEQLGEHDLLYHSNSLYTPQIHVPLIISFPGVLPANRRFDEVVSLAHLPSTVMDLLGAADDHPFPRESLRSRLVGPESAAPASLEFVTAVLTAKGERLNDALRSTPIAKGSMCSVISSTHQYVLNGDGSEELYAYVQDPDEELNLVHSADFAHLVERMRRVARTIPHEHVPAIGAAEETVASPRRPRRPEPLARGPVP
jgi:arylsulfatase A-like enzyme